jgi:hypothetical protein
MEFFRETPLAPLGIKEGDYTSNSLRRSSPDCLNFANAGNARNPLSCQGFASFRGLTVRLKLSQAPGKNLTNSQSQFRRDVACREGHELRAGLKKRFKFEANSVDEILRLPYRSPRLGEEFSPTGQNGRPAEKITITGR